MFCLITLLCDCPIDTLSKEEKIIEFRKSIQQRYNSDSNNYNGGFDEILCYELHSQTVNQRMMVTTFSGFHTGLTFKELAQKWGISVSFLGELIADHCKKLEEP